MIAKSANAYRNVPEANANLVQWQFADILQRNNRLGAKQQHAIFMLNFEDTKEVGVTQGTRKLMRQLERKDGGSRAAESYLKRGHKHL